MSVNFRRFRSGEPWRLTEPTANAIIESAENWARHRNDPLGQDPPAYAFQGNLVQVQNNSGAAMPRFAVAGISGPLISPTAGLADFQNYPRFTLRTPTAADAAAFCVTIEPLAAGGIGLAMISGVVPCMIRVYQGDPTPVYASPIPGQTNYLQAIPGGAAVLWCDTLTASSPNYSPASGSAAANGTPWAIVRIPAAPAILDFVLKGDITPGGQTSAYAMTSTGGGPDTAQPTITVYDAPEGVLLAYGRTTAQNIGGSTVHGARGKAVWNTGTNRWEIISCQQKAQLIRVNFNTSSIPSVAASGSFTPTALFVMDRGQDPSFGSSSYPTITNYSAPIQAAGGNVSGIICSWDQAAGVYYVIDGPC